MTSLDEAELWWSTASDNVKIAAMEIMHSRRGDLLSLAPASEAERSGHSASEKP